MDGILPLNKDRGMTSHDAVFNAGKFLKHVKLDIVAHLIPMLMVFYRSVSVEQLKQSII